MLNLLAWRAVARTIVTMEQTYVTAAFFRHLTVQRHQQRIASLYDEGHQQLVEGEPCCIDLQNLCSSAPAKVESKGPAGR